MDRVASSAGCDGGEGGVRPTVTRRGAGTVWWVIRAGFCTGLACSCARFCPQHPITVLLLPVASVESPEAAAPYLPADTRRLIAPANSTTTPEARATETKPRERRRRD